MEIGRRCEIAEKAVADFSVTGFFTVLRDPMHNERTLNAYVFSVERSEQSVEP
jgi:hypothetical protein